MGRLSSSSRAGGAEQRAWEADLLREAEPLRRDGRVQLGAVTRIVVATAARPTGS